MRIVQYYSHLNGFEYIKYHKPQIWDEFEEVVNLVDAERCRTKISEEKRKMELGINLFSPIDMNKEFVRFFGERGWKEQRVINWLTEDTTLLRDIMRLPPEEQKKMIEDKGLDPILNLQSNRLYKRARRC